MVRHLRLAEESHQQSEPFVMSSHKAGAMLGARIGWSESSWGFHTWGYPKNAGWFLMVFVMENPMKMDDTPFIYELYNCIGYTELVRHLQTGMHIQALFPSEVVKGAQGSLERPKTRQEPTGLSQIRPYMSCLRIYSAIQSSLFLDYLCGLFENWVLLDPLVTHHYCNKMVVWEYNPILKQKRTYLGPKQATSFNFFPKTKEGCAQVKQLPEEKQPRNNNGIRTAGFSHHDIGDDRILLGEIDMMVHPAA